MEMNNIVKNINKSIINIFHTKINETCFHLFYILPIVISGGSYGY